MSSLAAPSYEEVHEAAVLGLEQALSDLEPGITVAELIGHVPEVASSVSGFVEKLLRPA